MSVSVLDVNVSVIQRNRNFDIYFGSMSFAPKPKKGPPDQNSLQHAMSRAHSYTTKADVNVDSSHQQLSSGEVQARWNPKTRN